MPITTNQRKPNGYITFRTNSSDGLLLSSANSSANETVSSMGIVHAMWSVSGTNTWSIARGSNTVLVLAGSGSHDYQGEGIRLETDDAQLSSNVTATLSGGTGTLILKLHKQSGQ
jgi:hypothetical protein